MRTIEERAKLAGLTYQFCKERIEADHKVYEKGYIQGATEQKAIDDKEMLDKIVDVCEAWEKFYLRKAEYPSKYSRSIAPEQFNAVSRLKEEIFKAVGVDAEKYYEQRRSMED